MKRASGVPNFELATVLVVACGAVACSSNSDQSTDRAPTDSAITDSFSDLVAIPMSKSCGQCHGQVKPESGLELSGISSDQLKAQLVNVPSTEATPINLITPFDLENSFLLRKVKGDLKSITCANGCGNRMPLGNAYPQRNIIDVEDWIMAGAR